MKNGKTYLATKRSPLPLKVSVVEKRLYYAAGQIIPSSIPGVLFSLDQELQAAADNALYNDRN
jgi:hypothetical protein